MQTPLQTKFVRRFAGLLFGAVLLAGPHASAVSGTSQVAWPGKVVAAETSWPEGVLALVNDPLRTKGWNPWFSEWPNDLNRYGFQVTNTSQVNRLLQKLAAVKSPKLQLRLNPEKEARSLGFSTVLDEGNGTGVLFSIGNQARLDEWFARLPEETPGVRKFGVHRLREAPTATPPTLTLFVAHPAVQLEQLEIPKTLEVVADIPPTARASATNLPALKVIDDFVALRKQPRTAHP